jgi:hypothetical protein
LGDPGVEGRVILRWIFRKCGVWVLTEGQVAGTRGCGNVTSGPIIFGNYLQWLKTG